MKLPIELLDKIVMMCNDIKVADVLKINISNYAYNVILKRWNIIEKIEKAGIKKLTMISKDVFSIKVRHAKCSAADRKRKVLEILLKKIEKCNQLELENIDEIYFPKKLDWVNNFSVNEEVLVLLRYHPLIKGVVHKINKKTIQVRTYDYKITENLMTWTTIENHARVMRSELSLIKRGEGHDILFERGEKRYRPRQDTRQYIFQLYY